MSPRDISSGSGESARTLNAEELMEVIDTISALSSTGEGDAINVDVALPVVQVCLTDEGWKVSCMDLESQQHSHFSTRSAAVRHGRTLARAQRGTLILHRVDGTLMESFHYDGA